MKRVIIKQFLHDGYVLYFTDEAVNSDKGIIGFYFDGLGFPQSIHRDSIFGSYIVGAKNDALMGVEAITITSVEVKDPRGRPLSDDEIKNGITAKFDYKAFTEGAKNT